jgi:hypothetical protein
MHYSTNLSPDVISLLPQSSFVSFAPEPGSYFAKLNAIGGWKASLSKESEAHVLQCQESIQHFDAGLQRIIFGKDGIMIIQLETGYLCFLDEKAHDDHPLRKASSPCVPGSQASTSGTDSHRIQWRILEHRRGIESLLLRRSILFPQVPPG